MKKLNLEQEKPKDPVKFDEYIVNHTDKWEVSRGNYSDWIIEELTLNSENYTYYIAQFDNKQRVLRNKK